MTRIIKTDLLSRVEGEGGMSLRIGDGKVLDARINILEPPRFFEALLEGRRYTEAPDITSRICGICPVAYQISSVNAMEHAFGIVPSSGIKALRRLLYCGEWIESHALHVFMLHAPDFLGFESAIHMARDHRELVKKALRLKKAGNSIVALLGGREIHPVNVRVGGFYRTPLKSELAPLAEELKWARDFALEAVKWAGSLEFPPYERDYLFVSLTQEDGYPIENGRLISSSGLDISPSSYEEHFEEYQVEHSTALYSKMKDAGEYLVGPLARYSLNFGKLSLLAQEAAIDAGLGAVVKNPFKSVIVRCVEMLYACEEALRIIEEYREPDSHYLTADEREEVGCGVSEAPRGLLYHRYSIGPGGLIKNARISPPTSQNQKIMESDLLYFGERFMSLPDNELRLKCERVIRNYDPCISCSTHAMKLKLTRD